MDDEIRKAADRAFEEALEEHGARDPREFYRTILRELKGGDAQSYQESVEEYERDLLPSIAQGRADPLQAWLGFGLRLASRLHPGRSVEIDASGRASPLEDDASWRTLVLHLPDDRRARAIVVSLPPEPTPAQRATIDLLASGKVTLDEA